MREQKKAELFAQKLGTEIFQKYMLQGEGVLLGRIEENLDPTHPSFVPNMEDHLMFVVDR